MAVDIDSQTFSKKKKKKLIWRKHNGPKKKNGVWMKNEGVYDLKEKRSYSQQAQHEDKHDPERDSQQDRDGLCAVSSLE